MKTSDTRPRIALVGTQGRVGRSVARVLAGADVTFRALALDPETARANLGPHAHAIGTESGDGETLERALDGVECLLIAESRPAHEATTLDAAYRAGVGRIVKITSVEATVAEQHASERLRTTPGVEWTIVSLTATMQRLADVLSDVVRDGVVRLPAGDARVAWVDARDVAAVAVRALLDDGHAGQDYVATGPESLGHQATLDVIGSAAGRSLRYESIDPADAPRVLASLGLSPVRARRVQSFCESLGRGRLAQVTNVVGEVGRVEPRTLVKFAALHDWKAVEFEPRCSEISKATTP